MHTNHIYSIKANRISLVSLSPQCKPNSSFSPIRPVLHEMPKCPTNRNSPNNNRILNNFTDFQECAKYKPISHYHIMSPKSSKFFGEEPHPMNMYRNKLPYLLKIALPSIECSKYKKNKFCKRVFSIDKLAPPMIPSNSNLALPKHTFDFLDEEISTHPFIKLDNTREVVRLNKIRLSVNAERPSMKLLAKLAEIV